MPTMKDVAKKAGVSLGTVSNVLNHRDTVLPKNREKVLQAVAELGFRTNMAARTLKTRVSNNIALILPDICNPFYPELARGVEDAALRAGFTVFLCNNDRSIGKECAYIESLIQKNVSGMILVKPQARVSDIVAQCAGMAITFVDTDAPPSDCYNVVNVDDAGGIRLGMEYLWECGHRKIAFVGGLQESSSSANRQKAYAAFMRERALDTYPRYMVQGDYTWESGYRAAGMLMALESPPTAIFAANDLMAIGCMKALQENGACVPGDVSVLGYDNIEMGMLCAPSLTTIDQPKYEMGAQSVEMLSRLAKGCPGSYVQLPTSLVIRGSVCNRT